MSSVLQRCGECNREKLPENMVPFEEHQSPQIICRKCYDKSKKYCKICNRLLDNPSDPTSEDCGGDCLKCMAELVEDPDCQQRLSEIRKVTNG